MKHIKKKFRFERQLKQENFQKIKQDSDNLTVIEKEKLNIASKKKIEKGTRIFAQFTNNKIIECFHLKRNGNTYYVPEPDPILIYFNNAYFHFKALKSQEKELFKNLNAEKLNEGIATLLYAHFGNCMGFITSLFTSMEAFINSQIPHNYIYKVEKTNHRTELYNYEQIQRHISFDDKWNIIMVDLMGKNFSQTYPIKNQHLINLKEFRNMIIHTKAINDGSTPYNYLFKKAFDFKYEDSLFAVRDYINFYKENYIEECDCGNDN